MTNLQISKLILYGQQWNKLIGDQWDLSWIFEKLLWQQDERWLDGRQFVKGVYFRNHPCGSDESCWRPKHGQQEQEKMKRRDDVYVNNTQLTWCEIKTWEEGKKWAPFQVSGWHVHEEEQVRKWTTTINKTCWVMEVGCKVKMIPRKFMSFPLNMPYPQGDTDIE